MNYIQISIEADEAGQELLISELSELAATGFEQTDTHLIAYFNEDAFPSYDVLTAIGDRKYAQLRVAEQNWNETWEQNFPPVVVEDFCAVRAHFHETVPGVQHEILITPKMSFGTGHHATTYMMMLSMRDMDFKDKKVFDFGTGTGLLAILAEKLGAASVLGIDNDEWSQRNAEENLANNRCRITGIRLSSNIPAGESFDVILANINRNVILQYLPQLDHALESGGQILFSGLLVADEQAIRDACTAHPWKYLQRKERNGWIALLFNKQ